MVDGLAIQNQPGTSTFSLLRRLPGRDIISEIQDIQQGCKRIVSFYNRICNIINKGSQPALNQAPHQAQPQQLLSNPSGSSIHRQQLHTQQLILQHQPQPHHQQLNQQQHLPQQYLQVPSQDTQTQSHTQQRIKNKSQNIVIQKASRHFN